MLNMDVSVFEESFYFLLWFFFFLHFPKTPSLNIFLLIDFKIILFLEFKKSLRKLLFRMELGASKRWPLFPT